MRGFVHMASRDVDTFHKVIQYALEKLGKAKFGFERTACAVSNLKAKDTRALETSLLIIPRGGPNGAAFTAFRGVSERF